MNAAAPSSSTPAAETTPRAAYLTLPGPGDQALRRVLKKVGLLALRQVLTIEPRRFSAPLTVALLGLQRALASCIKSAPAETLAAIGSPEVLPAIGCLVRGALPPPEALRLLGPSLGAALRHYGAAGRLKPWSWQVPFAEVFDPARGGVVRPEGGATGFVLSADGLNIETEPGGGRPIEEFDVTPELRPLEGLPGVDFATFDTNPIFDHEEHPEKEGNAIDLGGRPAAEWLDSLGAASGVIEQALPALHQEMAASLRRIVPVGYHERAHLSASYSEAPGLVYMSLHPSILTMAEALIHETQHGKLNALGWLDPLIANGQSELVTSPVRPDPRPLLGVLLAVHAFIPVAALHRRLADLAHPLTRDPGFNRRRREVLSLNADGLRTLLARSRWTPQGARIRAALISAHDETVLAADDSALSPAPPEAT